MDMDKDMDTQYVMGAMKYDDTNYLIWDGFTQLYFTKDFKTTKFVAQVIPPDPHFDTGDIIKVFKFDGKWVAMGNTHEGANIAYSDNLVDWKNQRILLNDSRAKDAYDIVVTDHFISLMTENHIYFGYSASPSGWKEQNYFLFYGIRSLLVNNKIYYLSRNQPKSSFLLSYDIRQESWKNCTLDGCIKALEMTFVEKTKEIYVLCTSGLVYISKENGCNWRVDNLFPHYSPKDVEMIFSYEDKVFVVGDQTFYKTIQ